MSTGRWPRVGPSAILVPCLRECDCGATWYGEPDEKMIGLYWWRLFKMPEHADNHEQGRDDVTEKLSPILESVVRALHVGFDSYGPTAKELAVLDGRKAIEAMYDCTQGMRMAGHAALDASEFSEDAVGSRVGYAALGEVWRAMLDEALRRRT